MTRIRSTFRRRAAREDGASLVEFALVAPVLFLVVFGIIDFGWIFAQHQDVRHGGREAARLAVVNYSDGTSPTSSAQPGGCGTHGNAKGLQLAQIVCEVKDRTGSLSDDDTTVLVHLTGTDIGDSVKVRICYPTDSVTGFFDFLDIDLESTVEMRLEQEPDFGHNWDGSDTCTPNLNPDSSP